MNKEQMKYVANLISQDIEKDKEIERLNNIINELEYCIENSYGELGYGIFYIFRINGKEECFDNINEVKEVIQKLKEEKSKKE